MNDNDLIEILRSGGNVIINNLTIVNVDGYNVHIGDNAPAPQTSRRLRPATRQYPVYYTPEQIDGWEREYEAREQQTRNFEYAEMKRQAYEAQDRANTERRLYEALNLNRRK